MTIAEIIESPAFYILVALPVIGTRQRALATLLHEAAHGTLARSRRLNRFLGTYPSGYLILQSFAAYRRSHVRDHHGLFGDPQRDPDLRAHVQAGLYQRRSGRRFVVKFLLAPLVGTQTPAVLRELLHRRLVTHRSMGVLAYVAAVATAATMVGGGRLILVYWLVPLLIVFPLVNWYIELLEHFPLMAERSLDVRMTRHRAVGAVSKHFFGIHNEGYHLDHHLSPGIPFWNLPAAHAIRLRDPLYADAITATVPARGGIWAQFRDMISKVEHLPQMELPVNATSSTSEKPDGDRSIDAVSAEQR
ncbi:fatty acid desaturase family protein [Actinomadura alba]|uniref:Fatty acid desaturase family protein n=1 Tax=Actinomadura alba TaxID=406431 RepID=A0ABR7LP29_9ACTN|nr:fatty acid desaturase family protein [Actinomadura alba]MBC6466609.1 fatty acid desaturase family protein [Actinomadura alba]